MCFSKKKKKNAKVESAPKTKPEDVEVKVEKEKKATQATRTYHVVKREDGKWEVKFAGGKKAIKLFDTQAEAVAYTKTMANNQEGAMLVHNSKGKNKGRIKSK